MNDRLDLLIKENDALMEQNKKERKETGRLRIDISTQAKECEQAFVRSCSHNTDSSCK